MSKINFLLILMFSITSLYSSKIELCKTCHPKIYREFQQSQHRKSIPKLDKVHGAVWNLHPLSKKTDYKCAKCHSPKENEGVTCLTCHTIVDIEEHSKSNKNIYETKPKTLYSAQKGSEDKKIIYHEKSYFFGLFTKTEGSPYHNIDYTNKNYYDANMCMGCHSHKSNSSGFVVCKTDKKGVSNSGKNCITCHMPQVKGSATTIRKSETHAFHGFAGVRNYHEMLSKYIDLEYKKSTDGFDIIIKNKAPHDLLTHPLRVVKLVTNIKRDDKRVELKPHTFAKILAKDNKPAMPWLANSFLKNDMIKANENRVVKFEYKLKKGDKIEVKLGYFIVNPKAVKKLGLKSEKGLSQFVTLKSATFYVK